jgi:protein-export membrane protein SecD
MSHILLMSTNNTSVKTSTFLRIFRAIVVLSLVAAAAWFVYHNAVTDGVKRPFKLGLDLAGGSHLVYEADTTDVDPAEVPDLMNVLRTVIEKRINIFGVSEPIIQVERGSFVTENPVERLVVELPGVTDVTQAIAEIGRTPLLEFKLLDEQKLAEQQTLSSLQGLTASGSGAVVGNVKINGEEVSSEDPYTETGLTGRYLESAALEFAGGNGGQLANEPLVSVRFTPEGAALFAQITRDNVGSQLGIFLDGELLSSPRINESITGGTAVISGGFTPDEARELSQNLSFGALPLPITLESTQTIGASLGVEVLQKGVFAGAVGLGLVILFMMLWYRIPGLIAGVALMSYVTITLALFQFIPVTLTAAGLAGFILSLGMAVDANVLVFERMKEEWRAGSSSHVAAQVGFARAWSAIRDGNITSLLSCIILFWFGTSLVKGFALVFGVGILVSMFSAIVISRTLLMALPDVRADQKSIWKFLLGSGLQK